MTSKTGLTLYSGGHKGTESEFGQCAERWGINEVNYTFEGHNPERQRGLVQLSREDLVKGDVSMEIVFRHMGRTYHQADHVRRVIQSIYHMVVNSHQVFAVGWIQDSGLVKGGTGWGVELAKFFNRRVSVYDQGKNRWFTWNRSQWEEDTPTIGEQPFAATGTRNLTDEGRAAIHELFNRSFGAP